MKRKLLVALSFVFIISIVLAGTVSASQVIGHIDGANCYLNADVNADRGWGSSSYNNSEHFNVSYTNRLTVTLMCHSYYHSEQPRTVTVNKTNTSASASVDCFFGSHVHSSTSSCTINQLGVGSWSGSLEKHYEN